MIIRVPIMDFNDRETSGKNKNIEDESEKTRRLEASPQRLTTLLIVTSITNTCRTQWKNRQKTGRDNIEK